MLVEKLISGIYLIADNEWIDINDSTKMLQGRGHITGFNAHPIGIPGGYDDGKKVMARAL